MSRLGGFVADEFDAGFSWEVDALVYSVTLPVVDDGVQFLRTGGWHVARHDEQRKISSQTKPARPELLRGLQERWDAGDVLSLPGAKRLVHGAVERFEAAGQMSRDCAHTEGRTSETPWLRLTVD